jgi:predicted DNA-binding transcriptional regulator AlpA
MSNWHLRWANRCPAETMTEFVTLGEVAQHYGVGAPAVSNWRKRFTFPAPIAGRVFRSMDIVEWMAQNKAPSLAHKRRAISLSMFAGGLQTAYLVTKNAAVGSSMN